LDVILQQAKVDALVEYTELISSLLKTEVSSTIWLIAKEYLLLILKACLH